MHIDVMKETHLSPADEMLYPEITGIFQMFFHMLPLVQDQLKTSSTDLYVQELMFQPE